jgi:hypothetical protein
MNPIKMLFQRQPERSETAALRDELITLRTEVVFATAFIADLKRKRRREPRRDKQSVIDAKKDTTAKLQRLVDAQRFAELEPKLFAGMRVSRDGLGKAI